DAKSTQAKPTCHSFRAMTAIPTTEPVIFLDSAASVLNLAETASHRLGAARRLLEVTATYKIPQADGSALYAISEAAYLLLSDGCDLFNALAFRRKDKGA